MTPFVPANEKPTLLYLIGMDEIRATKVGYSADPQARALQLQLGCPYQLYVRDAVPMITRKAVVIERHLLVLFAESRMLGEWVDEDWHVISEHARQAAAEETLLPFVHLYRNPYELACAMIGSLGSLSRLVGTEQSLACKWRYNGIPEKYIPLIAEHSGVPVKTYRELNANLLREKQRLERAA